MQFIQLVSVNTNDNQDVADNYGNDRSKMSLVVNTN